jgi:hypothetical protein
VLGTANAHVWAPIIFAVLLLVTVPVLLLRPRTPDRAVIKLPGSRARQIFGSILLGGFGVFLIAVGIHRLVQRQTIARHGQLVYGRQAA